MSQAANSSEQETAGRIRITSGKGVDRLRLRPGDLGSYFQRAEIKLPVTDLNFGPVRISLWPEDQRPGGSVRFYSIAPITERSLHLHNLCIEFLCKAQMERPQIVDRRCVRVRRVISSPHDITYCLEWDGSFKEKSLM